MTFSLSSGVYLCGLPDLSASNNPSKPYFAKPFLHFETIFWTICNCLAIFCVSIPFAAKRIIFDRRFILYSVVPLRIYFYSIFLSESDKIMGVAFLAIFFLQIFLKEIIAYFS